MIDGAMDRPGSRSLLVITGSPGSGKSALLSRVAVLADPLHRPVGDALSALAKGTVPQKGAFNGVVWCHNKSERQIIEAIAAALGGGASTVDALLNLATDRKATIAIDALDETQDGQARQVASRVLRPLALLPGIRLLVATRRRPVRDGAGTQADLLDHLGADPASIIDLDEAPDKRNDMRAYVAARMRAMGVDTLGAGDAANVAELAERIAIAAGNSFLVAAIAARSAVAGGLRREDGTYALPTEVGEALAGYIEALPEPAKARAMLRPLAWAQGAGLPWGALWSRLAVALAKVAGDAETTYDDRDVRALLDHAGDLVVESVEASQPVYRLFHEALAEHLRAETDEVESHNVLASAMRELVSARPWPQVQRYITANLPLHLLQARRTRALIELLVDPTWDRCRREQTGDPLAAVGAADAAIERLLADSPTDLRVVPLCVVHSRAMSAGAPLILDVLARSGQLARVEMMANNLAYAPDRMLAYRQLCGVYAHERDLGAARRCFEEVRRSLPAMPQTHQPMAWFWVTEAAHDAGLAEAASAAANAALDAAFAIEGDGWDLPNGYFWAARACALIGLKEGTARIREALDALDAARGVMWRNQALQAASAARHTAFLERRVAEYFDWARYPAGPMRDGNIALALVDAGMQEQANRVFDLVGSGVPEGQADSNKRWSWALALSGRLDEAVASLVHVGDQIEKGKAIARIASVAIDRGKEKEEALKDKVLKMLTPLVHELLQGYSEPRSRARLIRILWLVGEQANALKLAEDEIATSHSAGPIADPRDGESPGELFARTKTLARKKTGKREMVSSVVPVSDEQWAGDAEFAARKGNLQEARRHLEKIAVPRYRARALAAIAKHGADPEQAVGDWLQAMAEARRSGRGVVDEVLLVGTEVLHRADRSEEAKKLVADLEAIDTRWELESFSEQYEALRRTMPPGRERTIRMTALLHVPRRLASTHQWTRDDVRAGWFSAEGGKRLFVLALMEANPSLADAKVLADAIRGSRSAFEQYHALSAAVVANLRGDERALVLAAVESEVRGVRRADGVDSGLGSSKDRMFLARQLLAAKD